MLVNPTVPELLRKSEKNRYSLVIATAKRARQISKGSAPMASSDEQSPITIAANEIGEGKIKVLDKEQWDELKEEKIAELENAKEDEETKIEE